MNWLLLFAAVLLGSAKVILSRLIKKQTKSAVLTLLFNDIFFLIACIIVTLVGISSMRLVGSVPFGLAAAYAASTVVAQILIMVALENGPVSLSSLFSSCGFILPSLWGWIRFHESVSVLHIIGLLVVLSAFVLATDFRKTKKFNWKWFLAATGSMIFAGVTGIVQKEFVAVSAPEILYPFLSIALLMAAALCGGAGAIAAAGRYKKEKSLTTLSENSAGAEVVTTGQEGAESIQKKARAMSNTIVFVLILGIVMGFLHLMNTYLTRVFPTIIIFPVLNGGIIVITTLVSAFLFREILSIRQGISILCGIAGILLISFG